MAGRYTYKQLDTMALDFLQAEGEELAANALRYPLAMRLAFLIAAQDRFCQLVPGTYTKPAGWTVAVASGVGYGALPTNFDQVWPSLDTGVYGPIAGRTNALQASSRADILSPAIGGPEAFDASGANVQGYATHWFIEGGYLYTWPYVSGSVNYTVYGSGTPSGTDIPTSVLISGEGSYNAATSWDALYPVLKDTHQIALAFGLQHLLTVREEPTGVNVWSIESGAMSMFMSIVKDALATSGRHRRDMRTHARG